MTTRRWFELRPSWIVRTLIALVSLHASACPSSKTQPTPMSARDASASDAEPSSSSSTKDDARSRKGQAIGNDKDQQNVAALADGGKKGGDSAQGDPRDASPEPDGSHPSLITMPGEAQKDAGSAASGLPSTAEQPQVASDPGQRGPWPVGVRTASLELGTNQHVAVEVWYPARIGSETGATKFTYDFLDALPPEAKAALPKTEIPVAVDCDCYRDLPIDSDHGTYPISIFVHHSGQFRMASASLMTHWASRGYVVLAADHPKLTLADVLADESNATCSGSGISADSDHKRDLPALLGAVRQPAGDFAFLAGQLDPSRIAVSGSGDGAPYSAAVSGESGVRLIMQWEAATSVSKGGDLGAVVFVTGSDGIPSYASIQSSFQTTGTRIKPTLFVGISNAGHLSSTDICSAHNPLGRTGIDIAQRYQLCGINFDLLSALFPCSPTQISQMQADMIYSYATTAALDEFLLGKNERAAWDAFKPEWGEVLELR